MVTDGFFKLHVARRSGTLNSAGIAHVDIHIIIEYNHAHDITASYGATADADRAGQPRIRRRVNDPGTSIARADLPYFENVSRNFVQVMSRCNKAPPSWSMVGNCDRQNGQLTGTGWKCHRKVRRQPVKDSLGQMGSYRPRG